MTKYVKRPPRLDALPEDNPESIAKHAICVVEKAIKERFGLEVHAGTELEYSLHVPNASKRAHQLRVLSADADNVLFPKSPYVGYSYKEKNASYIDQDDSYNGWRGRETVIKYDGSHSNVPMGEGRLLVEARAVEALRRTIAFPKSYEDTKPLSVANERSMRWINDQLTERITDAQHTMSHGMHLNLSLHNSHGNIMGDNKQYFPNARDERIALKAVLLDVWREAAHLLVTTQAAEQREEIREGFSFGYPVAFKENDVFRIAKDPARVEFNLAPSSANPYYVNLVGLLSLYHMLESTNFKNKGDFHADISHYNAYPRANEDAKDKGLQLEAYFKKRFLNGKHLIRDMLDGMEDGLGSGFEEAIKRIPPGTEKPREAAGIVSYEDIVARRTAKEAGRA